MEENDVWKGPSRNSILSYLFGRDFVAKKRPGLIYKISSLQATLPFPRRDRPDRIAKCTAVERFRLPLVQAVQFPRDVSISVGRRALFRCIQFHIPPIPCTLPPLFPPSPMIHIADAGFRYFRFGDGLTLPIQNYRVPFTIACIRCLFSTEAYTSGNDGEKWFAAKPYLSCCLLLSVTEETFT